MQATKRPGLAKGAYGEQTNGQKTYGKSSPCLKILHDGAATASNFHRMTDDGYLAIPSQRASGVNLNYPLTGRDSAKSGLGHLKVHTYVRPLSTSL